MFMKTKFVKQSCECSHKYFKLYVVENCFYFNKESYFNKSIIYKIVNVTINLIFAIL